MHPEEDYAYILNLIDTTKLDLNEEAAFNMYQDVSSLSLVAARRGEVFSPGNSSKDKHILKGKGDLTS